MDKLVNAYSGDLARGYDARRSRSRRWQAETVAMEGFLRDLKPATVLDCPFGTGRWIPQYEQLGSKIIGIDLSQAMLDEAAAKLTALAPERRAAYRLLCGSIFDVTPEIGAPPPDLTVCIRFLNWVPFDEATRALEKLTALGSRTIIVGASVVPSDAGPLRRAWYNLSLKLINLRAGAKPQQYVHAEADLLESFRRLGWRVAGRQEIMRRNARVNYFYRLDRA